MFKSSKPCGLDNDIEVFDYEMHVAKGKLSAHIAQEVALKETWIPWSSQGMTYSLCFFHEQTTHIYNCDTASKPENDN